MEWVYLHYFDRKNGGKMNQTNLVKKNQTQRLLEEVARCRTKVLDDCELELGETPRWKFFRRRLLKIFGHRGLEGKISEIMELNSINEVSK